jgi:hypothetical protein
MKARYETLSANELLEFINFGSDKDRDLRRDAEAHLLQRWRDGIDLDPLIHMLESKTVAERLNGAFYLIDAVPRSDRLIDIATRLSTDPLTYCRKSFVGYMTNAGIYDDTIAIGLAACLNDPKPVIRAETINWAVYTTDDRFADFSNLVIAGADRRRHETAAGMRALTLAERLRAGVSVFDLESELVEDDRLILDCLQIFERRLKRYVDRRNATTITPTTAPRYDDFERGAIGETYDNLGMLKGDLPATVPSQITDAELNEAIERGHESRRHRKFDQAILDMSRRE